MNITIGNITFDNVDYDVHADVLYLHKGDPSTAVTFDETPEGHHVRFNASGDLVGLTIVSPRHLLDRDGKLEITLPQQVEVSEDSLSDALIAA